MENILLDMKDIYEIIKIAFENNQTAIFKVRGMSMFPLLRDRRDSVTLKKIDEAPKNRDIILYKRDSGQFVLHRIVKVENGVYTLVGDNQSQLEYPIRLDQILGVVVSINRKGKEIDLSKSKFYKVYSYLWCFNIFIRRVILKIIHTVNKNSYLHN